MTLIVPNGALKKHSPKPLTLIGFSTRWADTKTIVTFRLSLVAPDGSTEFYNPRWYVSTLGGIGNEGSDYASRGPLPFCLTI